MEPKEQPPRLTNYQYEIKNNQTITSQDLQDLDQLARDEQQFVDFLGTSLEQKDLNDSAMVHSQVLGYLKDSLKDNEPFEGVLCRDQNNKLVGYSFTSFPDHPDNNELITRYVGVKNDYRKQGLGLELLRRSLESLSQKGVRSFRTYSREGVLRLYDRLGVHYTLQKNRDTTGGLEVSVTL